MFLCKENNRKYRKKLITLDAGLYGIICQYTACCNIECNNL